MTDDAKEWVTIKVPKRIRDDAREDARTYGDLLRAGLDGDPAQPVTAEMPDVEAQLSEALADAGASPTAEEVAREVSRRIDYAAIATQTADEVEERLR